MKREKYLSDTAMGLLLASALPTAASAQVEDSQSDAESDRDRIIIVTGTKRAQSLQKEEASVAVITEKTIEDQALFDLRDALLRTANVSTLGGDGINNLSIRGIQLTGIGFTGSGATANVYVDGAPSSFDANQGASNLWDVKQVEILRGPQSTVQGRNALAGAIIINTADPEYDFGVRARGIVATENTYQLSGMVTGPIVADQIAFRIAADYREQDFGVTNAINGENSIFLESLTLRGKLLVEPEFAEGLSIKLTGSYADTKFGQFGQVSAPVPVTDPAFADFDIFGDQTFDPRGRQESNEVIRLIANVDYRLSDTWTVYAIGTYEDVDRFSAFGDAGFFDNPSVTYSGELRAAFDYGDISGWIGGYYFDNDDSSDGVFITPLSILGLPVDPPNSIVNLAIQQQSVTENYAVFGDLTWEISDKWSVNLGARYDWEDFADIGIQGSVAVDPPTCTVAPFVPGIGGLPCSLIIPVTNEPPRGASFEAFLPRGSVTYNFDEDRSIALSVARGYRAGGSFLFNVPGAAPEIREFGPEFLTNYELAFRSQWWDGRITLNANVFYSTWDDQQVSIPDPSGALFSTLTTNDGQSELYGMEVDFSVEIIPELTVFTTLGLLHTEFTDFPFAQDVDGNPLNPANPEFANLAGNSFTAAPEVNISMGFAYNDDSGFFVNGNGSFASEQFSDVTNLPDNESKPYFLVNGRIGYRADNFEVAIFANNLFNERVITRQGRFTVDASTGVPTANNPPFFVVNDPRVIGASVGINF